MSRYEDNDRAWAEIDLGAITFNIEAIKKKINKNTKIIAVIKADGYGHGAAQIADLLKNDGQIWGYAVATAKEAYLLRERGLKKPILLLGHTFCKGEGLIEKDIRPAVFTYETAKMLSNTASRLGKACKIHIKVDTGMNRIGLMPDENGLELVKKISKLPQLEIEGIFTHFAAADERDISKAEKQFNAFVDFVNNVEEQTGINIPLKHCSNSAGIVQMHKANLDAVRAGIILYGLYPSDEVRASGEIELKPVLTLKSRVVYVKTVPANCEISYGGTFTTVRDTKVATVCIGYGDGYPRSLSNVGNVLIKGQRVPIIGRVCMDQIMIDATDIDGDVKIGDIVTLIGNDGIECITMEELGELSGRFNYELACDIGARIPRIFKR